MPASETEQRFAALYEQHYARVYAYVVGRGAGASVDEVVADTFVVAFHAAFAANRNAGFVSLRVTANDAAGGRISETITRAYRLAR